MGSCKNIKKAETKSWSSVTKPKSDLVKIPDDKSIKDQPSAQNKQTDKQTILVEKHDQKLAIIFLNRTGWGDCL